MLKRKKRLPASELSGLCMQLALLYEAGMMLDDGLESTVLIMGGDCLLGLMRQLDVTEIMPLCEVAPGVVLSQFTYGGRQWNLVSKSGGFGAKTLFYDLQNILERWKKELPAV